MRADNPKEEGADDALQDLELSGADPEFDHTPDPSAILDDDVAMIAQGRPLLRSDQECEIGRARNAAFSKWKEELFTHPLTLSWIIQKLEAVVEGHLAYKNGSFSPPAKSQTPKKHPPASKTRASLLGLSNLLISAQKSLAAEGLIDVSITKELRRAMTSLALSEPSLMKLTSHITSPGSEQIVTPFETSIRNSAPYQDHARRIASAQRLYLEQVNLLMEHNYRLVISIARKYYSPSHTLSDLVSHGSIGLRTAAVRFDPEVGTKFSTYATWWIRRSISRGILNEAALIRVPLYLHTSMQLLYRTMDHFYALNGREGTNEELSELTGLATDQITRLKQLLEPPVSLESPVGERETSTLLDVLPDNVTPSSHAVLETPLSIPLAKAIDTLSASQRRVICLRFGVTDGVSRTLEEVAEILGLTREGVRQQEMKAIKRLRTCAVFDEDLQQLEGKTKKR